MKVLYCKLSNLANQLTRIYKQQKIGQVYENITRYFLTEVALLNKVHANIIFLNLLRDLVSCLVTVWLIFEKWFIWTFILYYFIFHFKKIILSYFLFFGQCKIHVMEFTCHEFSLFFSLFLNIIALYYIISYHSVLFMLFYVKLYYVNIILYYFKSLILKQNLILRAIKTNNSGMIWECLLLEKQHQQFVAPQDCFVILFENDRYHFQCFLAQKQHKTK